MGHAYKMNSMRVVAAALLLVSVAASPAASAQKQPQTRKKVAELLSRRSLVYWYTDISDETFAQASADGVFSASKMIEAGALSAPYRDRLLSLGVIAVAHAEISPDDSRDAVYRALKSPLAAGWGAVAIDQFMRGHDYANAIAAIKQIRKEYPGAALVAWCETGAPVSSLEPYIDLFIVDPASSADSSAFITGRTAHEIDARLNAASAALKKSGRNGAKALAKSIAAVCVCDSFNDASSTPDAFVCDDRAGVDFRNMISSELTKLRSSKSFSRGVALFSYNRTKPSTARFVNSAAAAKFSRTTTRAKSSPAPISSIVRSPGFEANAAADWTLEGGRAIIVKYSDSKLTQTARMGHAFTGSPQRAAVSHDAAGLRMEAVIGSCNSAMQTLKLEPGATYEISAFVTGEYGREKGSIWLFDKDKGRGSFSAFLPVVADSAFRWSNPSFYATVPKGVANVGLMLSDCDAMGAQAMWWDFVRVVKTVPASGIPSIISATPINNSIEGYGFHLQWDAPAFNDVSYSLLQYSLDGVKWNNLSTEFDGVYNTYWLPSGMAELPFAQIPPGQTVRFRVKMVLWGEKSTAWSAPFAANMPRYDGGAAPVLNFAAARGGKVGAAWLPPKTAPAGYTLQCAGADAKWQSAGDAAPGATHADFAKKLPSGATMCRLAATASSGPVYSNIVPLEK